MKWFSLLVVIFTLFDISFPATVFTESTNPAVIKSISYHQDSQTKETITFKLDASVVPKIFFISGEKPRLVLDFPQTVYLGKNIIAITEGVFASAIRTGLHQKPVQKTRAVIDLSAKMVAKYITEYVEQENTLIVILTPDAIKQQPSTPPKLQAKNENVLPSQKDIIRGPLDKKVLPPDFSAKKVAEELAGEKNPSPVVPMLLEITFEASANKGEMVLFRLNDFYPPIVSAIEKDTPRVICDFMAMRLDPKVQKNILANSRYVKRINTTMHQDPEKVQVVLELAPERDYDLQQVFFKNDNLFVLMVNELHPDQGVQ